MNFCAKSSNNLPLDRWSRFRWTPNVATVAHVHTSNNKKKKKNRVNASQ